MEGDSSEGILIDTGNDLTASNQNGLETRAVSKRKRRGPFSNPVNKPLMHVRKRTRRKRAKTNDVVDSNDISDSSNQYNHNKDNGNTNDATRELYINSKPNNICETLKLRVCLEDISLNSRLAEKYNLTVNSNRCLNETHETTEAQNIKSNENKSTKKKESPKKITNKLETLQVTVPPIININQQNLEKKTEPNNSYQKSPTVLSSPAKSDNSCLSSRSTSNLNISTSSKDSSYTKVLINNYPVIKPFNITINVGSNNQERKVEFSAAPTLIEPIASPDKNDFWQNEISNCDESLPVLQFYSGDWFFDITDDDLYNIITTDSIFTEAVLPSANSFEIYYSNSSPVSSRSLETFNDADSRITSFQFTKPILPPAKRPPTRRKNRFGSPSSCFSSTDSSTTMDKLSSTAPSAADDDAISLYSTWSIKSSDFCTKSTVSKSEDESDKPESKESNSNYLSANSMSSPTKKSPLLITTTVDNPVNFQDTQKQHVIQWLENTQTQKVYGDFYTIPLVFKPLCYFYYTYDYCKINPCRRKHNMNRFIHQNLMNLSNELLVDAYKFARSRRRLFHPLIYTFIKAFLKEGDIIELIDMVGFVAVLGNANRVPQVRQIIMGLQSNGRSFAKSIEEIMVTIREKDLSLSDVLLEIVCDEKADLNSNWYLIEMLSQNRNGSPINATIVDDIMLTCIDQENVEFSMKVVKDIFISDCVNLIAVNDLIFSRFISFLQNQNLTEQVDILLTKAKLNNVNIISSFPQTNNVWLDNQTFTNPVQGPQTFVNHFPENVSSSFTSWAFPNFDLPKNPLVTNSKEQQVNTFQNFNEEFLQNNWPNDGFESPNRESVEKYISNEGTVDNTMPYTTSESFVKQVSSDSEESSSSKGIISNSTLDNPMTNSNPSSPSATNKSLEYMDKCLSDYEVKKLCDIIANNRSEDLVSCYNKFKNSSFNNSFVMNVISLLKQQNKSIIYEIINALIENLEQQNSHFGYLDNAESTLYLLAVNVIALLKQQKGYQEAAKLLFKFKNSLENLLKVQWFRSIQKHNLSNAGKYLYFCQIFMRGEHLEEALQILTSSDLKLLNQIAMWTLQRNAKFDNDFRNDVVDEFVKISLKENLRIAKNIILHMITFKDNITELSLWKYFDDLILALLNSNGLHFNDLVQMLPNILQGWYKYLKKQNIRGLLVKFVSAKIPEKQLLALYNKCIKRHMYEKLKGTENSIVLKTDMTLEEIFITIRYYLYKLEHKNHEAQEVTINIKMPEQLSDQPQILITSDCRMQETSNRILLVLTRCFPTAIIAQITTESQILIKPTQIKLCVERYRKLNDASNCIWVRQSAVEKLGICDRSPLADTFTYNSKQCSR